MKQIDLTQAGGMPLDEQTLSFMQETYSDILKQLALKLGQYVNLNGTQSTGGWVSVNGEIMPYTIGSGNSCYVQKSTTAVTFQDGQSKPIYATKKMVFGLGSPQLNWSDFKELSSLTTLEAKVDAINSSQKGIIVMWAGSEVPSGWALCDGKNGTPNLIDRFIMGSNLSNVKKIGGAKSVTLGKEHTPPHYHLLINDSGYGGNSNELTINTNIARVGGDYHMRPNVSLPFEPTVGISSKPYAEADIASIDKSPVRITNPAPFSIIPPYYTLAYIQKL